MSETLATIAADLAAPLQAAEHLALGMLAALALLRSPHRRLGRWLAATPARACHLALAAMLLVFVVVASAYSIRQHLALHTAAYDLGIFDQVVWATSRGSPFYLSLVPGTTTFLGQHFAPLLFVTVPVYWLWPDPRALLILQVVFMAAGALPVYLLARRLLRPPALALAPAAAYLLVPALWGASLNDFHDLALATPLVALSGYLALVGKPVPAVGAMGLAMLAREDVALLGLGLAILLALRGHARLGAALGALSLAYLLILAGQVIPSLAGEASYSLRFRLGYLGAGPFEIARNLALHPGWALQRAVAGDRPSFLLEMLGSSGWLPLASPGGLVLGLPYLIPYLISENTPLLRSQYAAPLVPVFLLASTLGLARLAGESRARGMALATLLLATAALTYRSHSVGPGGGAFEPWRYGPDPHATVGHELMARIPAEARVSAQTHLVPHLSQRRHIYLFPTLADAELVLLDTRGDLWPFSDDRRGYEAQMLELRTSPSWDLEAARDGFLLFRRRPVPLAEAETARFGEVIALGGVELEPAEAALGGVELQPAEAAPGGVELEPAEGALGGVEIEPAEAAPGGVEIEPAEAAPGDQVWIRARWLALRGPREDLSLFIHVYDERGRLVAQLDQYPAGEALPTSRWEPGGALKWDYGLVLPADLPPGTYRVDVGLYRLGDLGRLPARGPQGRFPEDRVPIGALQVRAP